MDTEKDKLKNSHRAASVEKRDTGKEKKKHTEQEKTQNRGATINDLTAVTSAVAHEGSHGAIPTFPFSLLES